MKALVYVGKEKLEIQKREFPQDEITIKVIASGVCGTDIKTYLRGHHMFKPNSVLGHEFYGEIVSVSSHIHDYHVGEKVVVAPYYECGECSNCQKGIEEICTNKNFLNSGSFTEFIGLSTEYAAKGVFKVEEAHDSYTLVEPLACALNGIEKLDVIQSNNILIVGCGPMGSLFALALSQMGISVDILEINEWRVNILKSLGFHVVTSEELVDKKYDRIVLTVNQPDAAAFYLQHVADGGNILLFSGYSRDDRIKLDPYHVHYREVRITGSFGYSLSHFQQALESIEQDLSYFEKIITHKFPLESGVEAFNLLKNGEAMKLLLKV